MALSAHEAAMGNKSPYFVMFFHPDDARMVRQVMRNIVRAIGGHDSEIIIKCNEDSSCLETSQRDVGAYVSRKQDWREDYINLCRHILDGGPRTRPITNDWCSTEAKNVTLASILLHELTHIYPIAEYTETQDWAWDQHACKELARLTVRDQNGDLLLPTENAQSYVWYAESQLWWSSLYDAKACPQKEKEELRRQLLSVQDEDAALSLPEAGNSSSLGSTNETMTIQSPTHSDDIVLDP